MRPVYRADHVGSLLRPPEVLRARTERAAGRMGADELRRIEDRAISTALTMQAQIGLDVFTDGELRRAGWMTDVPEAVEGFVAGGFALRLRGDGPTTASTPLAVASRLRAARRITGHETAYLLAHAPGPAKLTIPSPTSFAYLCYQRGLTDRVYATPGDLLRDLVEITRAELQAVAAEGVPYVQLDAPRYTLHVDPTLRGPLSEWGMNLDRALDESIAADNACLAGLDRERVTIGLHLCRGNAAGGGWFGAGGYDAIAEKLFGSLRVDRLLLEYDTERAGGFAPLRFVPAGVIVVLGLLTTKSARLEPVDELLRRVEEASAYVPIERLALSPQCGFASVAPGNPLSPQDQRRKLERVVEVARRVWG